jgi:hypothetical protein
VGKNLTNAAVLAKQASFKALYTSDCFNELIHMIDDCDL